MISLHFDFTEVGALVIENQLYLMQPMNVYGICLGR